MTTIYTLERYEPTQERWLPITLGGRVERASSLEEIQARAAYFARNYPAWRLRAVEETR
jgi:hypothetical protein